MLICDLWPTPMGRHRTRGSRKGKKGRVEGGAAIVEVLLILQTLWG